MIYEIFAEYFDALAGRLEDLADDDLVLWLDSCPSPDWMLDIADCRDIELFLDLSGNLDAPL